MSEKKKGLFNRMFSTNGGAEEEPDDATVRKWLNEPDGPGGFRPRGYQSGGYQSGGYQSGGFQSGGFQGGGAPGGDRGQRQAFSDLASGFGAGGSQPAPAWPGTSSDYDDDADDGGGVEIGNIGAGGPLAEAGLREGDVIIAVDGSAVGTEEDLMAALSRLMPGRSAVLEVERGGSTLSAVVVAPG
ncbi:MAG TPA: PDZ domain-containing protein [Candidatus Dormibacteraeota bacterium]